MLGEGALESLGEMPPVNLIGGAPAIVAGQGFDPVGAIAHQEQVLGKASRTGQGPVLVKVLPIDLAFRNNLLACQDWEQGRLVHDCQIKELGCKTVPRIDHRTFKIDKAI